MVITDENFNEHFFPIQGQRPLRGQVMARFTHHAELVDGIEKRQIIDLLQKRGSAISATKVMQKVCHASRIDSVRVPQEMLKDLLEGLTEEEVAAKPYEFVLEMHYYTKPENIPIDNPHWEQISILNEEQLRCKILDGEQARGALVSSIEE